MGYAPLVIEAKFRVGSFLHGIWELSWQNNPFLSFKWSPFQKGCQIMLRSASFGSLISRDKGDARAGQQLSRTASLIKTVECRGVPVPESRHPACLNEVSTTQKNADLQKLPIVEELERKNRHNLPYLFEGGVDLRLLTSVLSSPSEVFEADLLWDHDSLLQELAYLEFNLKNDKGRDFSSVEASKSF